MRRVRRLGHDLPGWRRMHDPSPFPSSPLPPLAPAQLADRLHRHNGLRGRQQRAAASLRTWPCAYPHRAASSRDGDAGPPRCGALRLIARDGKRSARVIPRGGRYTFTASGRGRWTVAVSSPAGPVGTARRSSAPSSFRSRQRPTPGVRRAVEVTGMVASAASASAMSRAPPPAFAPDQSIAANTIRINLRRDPTAMDESTRPGAGSREGRLLGRLSALSAERSGPRSHTVPVELPRPDTD